MTYGEPPADLGLVDIEPREMMFWLYCPISLPKMSSYVLPANLQVFAPIVEFVRRCNFADFKWSWVYLTAKRLWVTPDNPGNRPGWHSDGFGTCDRNYIWCDIYPTEFYLDSFALPRDCPTALAEMDARAVGKPIVTFPVKHLLALTPSCIHRTPTNFAPGYRTFVKVSVSLSTYNLEGNSVNPLLPTGFDLAPRQPERNHPHVAPRENP